MIADVPTEDISEPLTLSPDVLVQGTTMTGVLVSAEEPLFANPDQTLSLGAGVLIKDMNILDDFTASVDVVVSPRAVLEGRAVVSEYAGFARMGAYDIIGRGNATTNREPDVKILVPLPDASANQPFDVSVSFDDADGDFVEVFLALKDLTTDHIVYRSKRKVHDTAASDPAAEQVTFTVPGFPSGPYKAVVEADDGIAFFVLDSEEFFIRPVFKEPQDAPSGPRGPGGR